MAGWESWAVLKLKQCFGEFYWEKTLPEGFKKPDSNASNAEVVTFLTNKYVHKKWANTDDWSNDPAWLYENKPKKF